MKRPLLRPLTALVAASLAMSTPTLASAAEGSTAKSVQAQANQYSLAHSFGTSVKGNALGVGSGSTALSALCTASPKIIERDNNVAVTDEGPEALAKVDTVVSHNTSSTGDGDGRRGGPRTSTSEVAVTGGDLAQGLVTFKTVTSKTVVATGAKPTHQVRIVDLVINGEEVPTDGIVPPDSVIEVPGLATVTLGGTFEQTTKEGTRANTTAVKVELADGTIIRAARSHAAVLTKRPGLYGGAAWGSDVDGSVILDSGRTGYSPLPCAGGDAVNDTATLNLPGGVGVIGATVSETHGGIVENVPTTRTVSHLADVDLLGGALIFKSLTTTAIAKFGPLIVCSIGGAAGRCSAKAGPSIETSTDTVFGEVLVGGQPLPVPVTAKDLENIDIPGLVSIKANVTEPINRGIEAHGLVITVLDVSGEPVVIRLGNARARIR